MDDYFTRLFMEPMTMQIEVTVCLSEPILLYVHINESRSRPVRSSAGVYYIDVECRLSLNQQPVC